MNNYYKILGLEPGADEKSIKRAYFRLVRQYSPESNPEMFQKIREAYEALTTNDSEKDSIEVNIDMPTKGTEGYYAGIVSQYQESGDHKRALEFAEQANGLFPDVDFFIYAMFLSQRSLGKTGKSAKTIGILSDKHPDDKTFARIYADALLGRGYHKKALSAYEKACRLGCDDLHFFINFALCCIYNRRYADALEHLLPFTCSDYKWGQDRREEAQAVYEMALDCAVYCTDREMVQILDSYGDFLERNKRALRGHFFYIVDRLFVGKKHDHFGIKTIPYVRRIFDIARDNCEKGRGKELEYSWVSMLCTLVENDHRLGDIFKQAVTLLPDADGMEYVFGLDVDNKMISYSRDGMKLVMLKKQEDIFEKEEILKADHPELYAFLGDVYDALRSEDGGESYRTELERKQYSQMKIFGNSIYFDRYPDELDKYLGKRISSLDPTEVYVRATPKIGRNDPCPCGSGKKYKKCCGR